MLHLPCWCRLMVKSPVNFRSWAGLLHFWSDTRPFKNLQKKAILPLSGKLACVFLSSRRPPLPVTVSAL